jgi:hypothetical protein
MRNPDCTRNPPQESPPPFVGGGRRASVRGGWGTEPSEFPVAVRIAWECAAEQPVAEQLSPTLTRPPRTGEGIRKVADMLEYRDKQSHEAWSSRDSHTSWMDSHCAVD